MAIGGRGSDAARVCATALLGVYMLLCTPVAQALDPDRAIRQLPHVWYENQLPQSTVLAIVQRADGAMWFATYGGLARYSGAEFTTFDRRNLPVLRSTAITALWEDRSGTLWVGTLNGGLYRSVGRGLEEVKLPDNIDSVFGLVDDRDGALWLTSNAGLARRDGDTFTQFGADDGFPRGPYRALVADPDGGLWIGVDGTGVVHRHDGKFDVLGIDAGLPSAAVYALRRDAGGTLWAGTQAGLVRLRDGKFQSEPRAASLAGQRIYALQGDRDGNLWIVTQGKGVCRLTPSRLECETGLRGLGNDIVRSIFEDREGSLWLGTTNNGVHRISDSKLITVDGDIASNSVRTVYEDAHGTLWMGTDGAGLVRHENHGLVADALNAHLLSPFTRSLAGDAAGNLWLGSIEGVSRIAADGHVRNFRVEDGLPAAMVFAMTPRREGGMWLATTQGLALVEGEGVREIAALRGNDIRALYEAPDDRLWIGQRSGLHCLRGDVLDQCGSDGLSNTSVFAFLPAADDSLWLGTSQGLMHWRNGRLDRYGEALGLAGDPVFAILDDLAGNFWISTNRGIARIAKGELIALDEGRSAKAEPQWFGKADGMLSAQGSGASQSPAWRTHDGRLWFGTANGAVQVDPAHLRSNTAPPPLVIEAVRVDGKDVDMDKLEEIGPGVDRLEFHYAGMSYVYPTAVRYRYKLEGYDRDWIDASERRAAYYTNLPHGQYVFRATASNNDGVWNEGGAKLAFSIAPHWHERGIFRALLALTGMLVLAGLYRLRLWRVRANERALKREVALRTEALRAANDALQRLASLDGLTRIGNRGAFDERLVQAWNEHRQRAAPLALLLCDIDAFKAYNDSYGHQAGDAALIRVAATLSNLVRTEADLAARYGGEELALLLIDCDANEAATVAERLLHAVRTLGIAHRASGVAPYLTLSIGLAALVPRQAQPPERLVLYADQALYRAKEQGRDRACAATLEASSTS